MIVGNLASADLGRRLAAPGLRTPFCELVGVDYPIVQTGMGWVAGPRLTAATSEAGGMGTLASATMTYEQAANAIAEIKDRTDRPFGVNLRANHADVQKIADLMIRQGVKLASFAQVPSEALIKKLKDGERPQGRQFLQRRKRSIVDGRPGQIEDGQGRESFEMRQALGRKADFAHRELPQVVGR